MSGLAQFYYYYSTLFSHLFSLNKLLNLIEGNLLSYGVTTVYVYSRYHSKCSISVGI